MPYKNPTAQKEFQRINLSRRREAFLKDKSCAHCGKGFEETQGDLVLAWNQGYKRQKALWSLSEEKQAEFAGQYQILCRLCHHKTIHRPPVVKEPKPKKEPVPKPERMIVTRKAKAAGWCKHPTCTKRAMSGAEQSSIRCEDHQGLCPRCWARPYSEKTGYCPNCWGAMVRNTGKFTGESHAVPHPTYKKADALLGVLDEFTPLWEIRKMGGS